MGIFLTNVKLITMTNDNIQYKGSDNNSVHHAPLIVDINAQRSYRKWGYVSWPIKIITESQLQKKNDIKR